MREEYTVEMRHRLLHTFINMNMSKHTILRIINSMEPAQKVGEDGIEIQAGVWVKRLEPCKTEEDVKKLLDKMGL